MTCEVCKFWEGNTTDNGAYTGIGECRRHAPRITHPLWPKTKMDHWCGEREGDPEKALYAGIDEAHARMAAAKKNFDLATKPNAEPPKGET